MTKYIISSGTSVISQIPTVESGRINYSLSNAAEDAATFDTIGNAMREAAKVNQVLGSSTYRVLSIEI